jgi:hypothetical protein
LNAEEVSAKRSQEAEFLALASELRPELHRYCARLMGSVLDGGQFNWLIWNDLTCGDQPCHVPPMLFAIYIVWGIFLIIAARAPSQHRLFLEFTLWANLAHGLLMVGQALTMPAYYLTKWFTDIPFILGLSLGLYLLRPPRTEESAGMGAAR